MTYMMAGENRPNPRLISNEIFNGTSGTPSIDDKTTMFVYFGKLKYLKRYETTVILNNRYM